MPKHVPTFGKIIATALTVVLLGTTAASAQLKNIGTYGGWTVSAGHNNGGDPMCTAWISDQNGRAFWIKYQSNNPSTLFFHVYKKGWNIPIGEKVKVLMQVDSAHSRSYQATAIAKDMLQFTMSLSDIDEETGERSIKLTNNLLRGGNMMRLAFPDGDEGYWTGSLNGSAGALDRFADCTDAISGKSAETQPHGGANSTSQPFGAKTTQPFRGDNTPAPVAPTSPAGSQVRELRS